MRVAIRVNEDGVAMLNSHRLTDSITMLPGEAYEVPDDLHAAKMQLASGGIVKLTPGQDAPQPGPKAAPKSAPRRGRGRKPVEPSPPDPGFLE